MKAESQPPRQGGLTAISGALTLIIILLVVQIWLLTASLESFLAGHMSVAVPGAIASALMFLACLGLYIFILRVDAEVQRD
jgi:hypothetical protein